MTETLWREAPSPALRVWRGPPLRWEANAAALAWAGPAGTGPVDWPALAERLMGGGPDDASALPGHRVMLPDGAVLWLQPTVPAAAANAAPPAGTPVAGQSLRPWEDESVIGPALTMAGVSLWEIDLAGQRVHYNQRGFRILGIERQPEGVLLDAVRAAIHPEDRPLIERAARDAALDDRLVDAVARYRDAAGHYKHLLTRRYRVRDKEGSVVALRGMSIDVSELVRERERSLSLLERMQMVAETIGVGFWWRDLDAGVFEWDEQMYRLHHRSPSEGPPSLDEWIARHVHPADRGWMAARQDTHYSKWTPASDVVFRTIGPDGQERFIQAWTRRLVRHGHRVSLGMHVDITERRQAELRREFERQRDQFAIEAAGIGVWERRATDGEPVYWSPTMYRLRGLAADDPRPLGEIVRASMQPEDEARATQLLHRCIATGERFAFEFEVAWPDGSRRWLASTGRAVHDTSGKPVAVAGVNVDVTERRRVDQIARERDRAQQASAAKSELMARVSHELRTPMNAVLGFADLMAADAPLPAAQAERLGRIRSAATHLLGQIDDLLDLARADPGEPPEESASAQPGALPAEPAPAGLRVLYIEDNPVNEMLVREMLALRPGVVLESAADGGSGIARARSWRPDLVLLDLQLPDMTGTEVLRSLRAEPGLAGSRFVALSANAMPQDVSEALAAGFDEYWTKPLNLQRFLADIDALAATLG